MILVSPVFAQTSGLPTELNSLVLFFVKWSLTILAVFYVLFAVMVIRQIKIMRQTLITSFSPMLRLIGYSHLILAIIVLFLFVFVL